VFLCLSSSTTNETFQESEFYVSQSSIHGEGLFTSIFIPANSLLFKVINKDKTVTKLGSKINHCQVEKTNTLLKELPSTDEWYLYSIKDIQPSEELTSDYNLAPKHLIQRPKTEWKC
jgi:hypothetical protein